MKKLTKVLLAVLFVLAATLVAIPAARTYAKSAKSQNKQAKKVLEKKVKNKFCSYGFIDIDGDGITEMVVREYSGKFVDGCDKKKSVSVYKVVNGKCKQIFTDSFDGDFFHPEIGCEFYSADSTYMLVYKSHEGYSIQTLYQYTTAGFVEVAYLTEDMAGCGTYRLGGEGNPYVDFYDFDGPDFEAMLKSYEPFKVNVEYNSCKTKTANKYLKKMLKAEYKYLCKIKVLDKSTTSAVYDDLDGDGIDEMIVRKGPKGGVVLYAYIPEYSHDYLVSNTEYVIDDNGNVIFEVYDYLDYEDEVSAVGDSYVGVWQSDRCSLIIDKEGDGYTFDILWGSSASETTEWFYYTIFEGETENGAMFSSDPHGRKFEYTTDDETGETISATVYENGEADFIIYDGVLTWIDYMDDEATAGGLQFEKLLVY